MEAFSSQIIAFVESARPIIVALVIFAFLICGGMFIYPSERSKQGARDSFPWIVIGAAIALGAVALGTAITSSF